MKISLYDKEFAHLNSYCGYDVPAHIEWDRSQGCKHNVAVFTERCFDQATKDVAPVRVAWLLEPRAIHDYGYAAFESGHCNAWATHVMTFDQNTARIAREFDIEPVFWTPGGSWIWRRDWQIYPKRKQISILASAKNWTVGHRLRQRVIDALGSRFDLVAGYNRAPIEPKAEAYADYRYSVAIENSKVDHYWTDKILDCFLCGTVPIYWGCLDLGRFFNMDGVITFDKVEELREILGTISESDYDARRPAIEDNFRRAQEFGVVEDFMYETFFRRFDR